MAQPVELKPLRPLERDDDCLNRFWDSLLVCFLIQAVGWVVEAGSDDQTLFYGFA